MKAITKRVGLTLLAMSAAGAATPAAAQAWRSDQGDGSFRNPVLYADYPDPDVIRVGSDFYMVSTTFVNVPGITLLQSKDLVNWQLVSHVAPRLDGREQYDFTNGNGYRKGLYASALRYRDGTFYIVNTPVGQKTRIYSSRDIRGPWKYHELDREAFDPGFFIDDDGKGYIATASTADGTITLLTLNADFTRVVDSRKIHYIKGAEGSHIVKRNGWYYLFNAIPPRLGLTVSRAKSLFGPWETHDQIDDKTGGHQGAIVDLPDGRDFGFVMVDAGSIGRMTNMSPIFWQDGWPVWGTPEAPGRVPERAQKPIQGFPFVEPPASDDFARPVLGLQWQWNHNPDDTRWSLTERPGFLRLRPTVAPQFWVAKNSLTQKGQGPRSRGEVKLDIRHVKPGDACGFGTLGQYSANIAVRRTPAGKPYLSMEVGEDTQAGPKIETRVASQPISGNSVWLRTDMDFKTDRGSLSYSLDGRRWSVLGGDFPLAFAWRTGTFQGEQFAISCYAPTRSPGYVDVDYFTLGSGGG